MTQIRLDVDDHTLRVLDVIKGKHGLKNRSQALEKFALENGADYVEPPVNEYVLKQMDYIVADHEKKYGFKAMSEEELDELLGLDHV